MRNLKNFLLKEEENEAHKEARRMGLKYRGFGYWANPSSGKVEYKTRDGKLVPVEGGDLSPEDVAGQGEEDGSKSIGSFADMMKGFQQQVDGGSTIGSANPDEEQVPYDDNDNDQWDSGPDGDTMVDKVADEEVPDDVFVKKTNDPKWTAGADGSNYTNWQANLGEQKFFEGWLTDAEKEADEMIAREEETPAEKAKRMGLTSDGHGRYKDANGEIVAKVEGSELVMLDSRQRKQEAEKAAMRGAAAEPTMGGSSAPAPSSGPVVSGGTAPAQDDSSFKPDSRYEPGGSRAGWPVGQPGKDTVMGRLRGDLEGLDSIQQRGKDALDKAAPADRDAALAGLEKTREFTGINGPTRNDEYGEAERMERDVEKIPAILSDIEKTKELNAQLVDWVEDPEYDLDAKGQEIASGAFGTVYLGQDDYTVIKDGEIGEDEMKALWLMSDNDQFPALVNAKFSNTFNHKSSVKNNPYGDEFGADRDMKVGPNKSQYFRPSKKSEFEDQYPTAPGTFAMSRAQGETLADAGYAMTEEQAEQAAVKAWEARAALHMKGISHNDMHGGNVYVNAEGEDIHVTILDLGLAKVNRYSALMEALAGFPHNGDPEDVEDYQLASGMTPNNLPADIQETMEENLQLVENYLVTNIYEGVDYEEIQEIMMGSIRMTAGELARMEEEYPLTEQEFNDIMNLLYDGIRKPSPKEELEQRMAAAYETQKGYADMIKMANDMRAERGEEPVEHRNPDVINPANLDRTN